MSQGPKALSSATPPKIQGTLEQDGLTPLKEQASGVEPEPLDAMETRTKTKVGEYQGARGRRALSGNGALRPMAVLMEQAGVALERRRSGELPLAQEAGRLVSRSLRGELIKAFGAEQAALFQLPTELMKMAQLGEFSSQIGTRVEAMVELLARAEPPLPSTLKNKLFAQKAHLGALAQALAKAPSAEGLWALNSALAPLMVEVAQAKGVYLKATPREDGFFVLSKLRPREEALAKLKVEDPAAFEIQQRRRSTFAAFEAEVEAICAAENKTLKRTKVLGALVSIGEDRVTKEQTVYSPRFGALPFEAFIKARKDFFGTQAKLRKADRKVNVDGLFRLSAEQLDALSGEAHYASLSDDRAQNSGLTRVLKVKEHEGREVVVEGRFAGLFLDQLINRAGRMYGGEGYRFVPELGRATKIPPRQALADREPYVSVARVKGQERLLVQLPNKQGEWTEVRRAVRKLSQLIPSIQYVEGSKNTAFYFEPKDFAQVREALGGMALSAQASENLRGYFLDLAQADQATASEHLHLYSLQHIGGFKTKLSGADGRVRSVDLNMAQKKALAWLEANGNRGVCALDTGMGKTLLSITMMQKFLRDGAGEAQDGRFLFVCPPALRGNLAKEIHRFMTPDAAKTLLSRVDVMSYAQLRNAQRTGRFAGRAFDPGRYAACFFDEAQALKNPSTKTARAALSLNHPHKICLTASPMEKDPMEAYVLSCVATNVALADLALGKRHRAEMRKFKARFCETFGGRVVGIRPDPLSRSELHTWAKQRVFYADKRLVSDEPLPKLQPLSTALTMSPEVEASYRKAAERLNKALRGMASLFRDKGVVETDEDGKSRINPDARHKLINTIMTGGRFSKELSEAINTINVLSNRPNALVEGAGNPKLDRAHEIIVERLSTRPESRTVLFSDDRIMVEDSAKTMSLRIPGKLHAACLNDEIHIYKNGARLQSYQGFALPLRKLAYRNDKERRANKTDNRHYPPSQWQQFALGELLGPDREVLSCSMLGQTYQVGQNLQAFDTCIHLDRDSWCAEDMSQRTARVWRQGQLNQVEEHTIDLVYAQAEDGLDMTLDEIRKHHQIMEGGLFDEAIRAAQTTELGREWFEMRQRNAAYIKLDQDTLSLMSSPYPSKAKPPGEHDVQ